MLTDIYVKSKLLRWQRPWQGLIAEDAMSVTAVMGSGGWAVINTLGKHRYLAMNNWSQGHGTELDGQTNPFFLNLGNRRDNLLVGEFIPDLGVSTMDHHEFSPISRLERIYSLIILGGKKRIMDLFTGAPEILPSMCTLYPILHKMVPWQSKRVTGLGKRKYPRF